MQSNHCIQNNYVEVHNDAISLFCSEYMNIVYVDVRHASDSQQAVRAPWGHMERFQFFNFPF